MLEGFVMLYRVFIYVTLRKPCTRLDRLVSASMYLDM